MTDEVTYNSMTFIGFNLQQVGKTVNLLSLNNDTIENGIMREGLYHWLKHNGVEMRQNPHTWKKFVYYNNIIFKVIAYRHPRLSLCIANSRLS